MVACAVPNLTGLRVPSLAVPMLQSANAAYLNGSRVEAAARLLEAVRRYLESTAKLHGLDAGGSAAELFYRCREADVDLCFWYREIVETCGEVLALRDRGEVLPDLLDMAFTLLTDDFDRGGAS